MHRNIRVKIQWGHNNFTAKHNLFEIDEGAKRLSERSSNIFHHIVAKLLFVSKRARPDIDLTISFLCSRVDKVQRKIGRNLNDSYII